MNFSAPSSPPGSNTVHLIYAASEAAQSALECGSCSYRLPPLPHTAIGPDLEPERR
jgi:hypothetical protein